MNSLAIATCQTSAEVEHSLGCLWRLERLKLVLAYIFSFRTSFLYVSVDLLHTSYHSLQRLIINSNAVLKNIKSPTFRETDLNNPEIQDSDKCILLTKIMLILNVSYNHKNIHFLYGVIKSLSIDFTRRQFIL